MVLLLRVGAHIVLWGEVGEVAGVHVYRQQLANVEDLVRRYALRRRPLDGPLATGPYRARRAERDLTRAPPVKGRREKGQKGKDSVTRP
ncbi:hypothetical protein GW17_00030867 [Ensete ventricosum]|nr:hypothetical protein GW17_00030867 [Ensete ventricosum]